MKKITYKKLMEKVENRDAQINAWSREGQVVDVTFHTMRSSKREHVIVTAIPAEIFSPSKLRE